MLSCAPEPDGSILLAQGRPRRTAPRTEHGGRPGGRPPLRRADTRVPGRAPRQSELWHLIAANGAGRKGVDPPDAPHSRKWAARPAVHSSRVSPSLDGQRREGTCARARHCGASPKLWTAAVQRIVPSRVPTTPPAEVGNARVNVATRAASLQMPLTSAWSVQRRCRWSELRRGAAEAEAVLMRDGK
jgi:hypothetical protein